MTTRALAMKLKRLENQAKMRLDWNNAEDSSPPVVLPPLEEFRVLPLEEQKRLLSACRPPHSGEEGPLQQMVLRATVRYGGGAMGRLTMTACSASTATETVE
jgi:hypothetical protein